jgi:HAD superfamily hydrolase (TIGR01459 family)
VAEPTTLLISGIEPLILRYDGFLVDQYGVLHDGEAPLPGAVAALELLRRAHKKVVLISNSGKRSRPNEERLDRIGIDRRLYETMVTSGETAWQGLRARTDETFAGLGERCLFLSRGGDRSALDGLSIVAVADTADADFLLLSGIDADEAARTAASRLLEQALARDLPLVCTNPDLVSIEGGRHVDGPGAFARRYELAGGLVRWVGKPWPAIYRAALAALPVAPGHVLAVGDSFDHDIEGAVGMGIAAALVTEGVHRDAFRDAVSAADCVERLVTLAGDSPSRPRFLLRQFAPTRGAH